MLRVFVVDVAALPTDKLVKRSQEQFHLSHHAGDHQELNYFPSAQHMMISFSLIIVGPSKGTVVQNNHQTGSVYILFSIILNVPLISNCSFGFPRWHLEHVPPYR